MGIGDGSLGRAVFQGSPGEVFQGSCRARRDAPCSLVFRLASTFWMLSYTRSFLLHSHLISLPVPQLLDIWTHTKNASSVAREKGLGNRLQDSLPSLNERETLHTAQRVGFFVFFSGLCVLLVFSLSLSLFLVHVILLIFFHLSGDVYCSFETNVPNERSRIPLEKNWDN